MRKKEKKQKAKDATDNPHLFLHEQIKKKDKLKRESVDAVSKDKAFIWMIFNH